MNRKSCACVSFFLLVGLLFQMQIFAANEQVFSWYCMRNSNHKQPIAEANMRFIEQYNGYYIDSKHGDDAQEKVVYLTFDAGYENGNVEKILDILKEEQVSGAFFILGNLIRRNLPLVQRMSDEGHLVCNHTESHKDMTKMTSLEEFEKELNALETLYYEATGERLAPYYRPPEGKFDEKSLRFASELGYSTVFWSFAYADWDNQHQMSAQKAKEKILGNIHNGAVLLLHPTSETNARILKDVIQSLKNEGYRFGTLNELTAKTVQPR